jgi:hypothetical protein
LWKQAFARYKLPQPGAWTDQIKCLPPGFLKSILQKLPRGAYARVSFPVATAEEARSLSPERVVVSTKEAMLATCLALLLHPGSFVPDLGLFVSGLVGLAKRLVVIAYEDSWPEGFEVKLLKLCGVALVSRADPKWRPPQDLVNTIFDVALACVGTPFLCAFSTKIKLPPFSISKLSTYSPRQCISALVDDLRAFPSDLAMIRHVASQGSTKDTHPKFSKTSNQTDPAAVVPIERCVDHHCFPGIGLLLPPSVVRLPSPPARPFEAAFRRMWTDLSGMNGRKVALDSSFEDRPFVKKARVAQRVGWAMAQGKYVRGTKETKEEETNQWETTSVSTALHPSWISGLLGDVQVKASDGKRYLVVVESWDPELVLGVARTLSRDNKATDAIPDASRESAEQAFLELLRSDAGLPATGTGTMIPPALRDARVFLRRSLGIPNSAPYFALRLKGTSPESEPLAWDELLLQKSILRLDPETTTLPPTTSGAVLAACSQVASGSLPDVRGADWREKLMAITNRADTDTLRRLVQHTSGGRAEIVLPAISRDGGSTQVGMPSQLDNPVFAFLCSASLVAPGLVRLVPRSAPYRFRVNKLVLMMHVRKTIWQAELARRFASAATGEGASISSSAKYLWTEDKFHADHMIPNKPRDMWPSQREGVAFFVNRFKQGFRSFPLFTATGSGKTLLTMEFLRWLQKTGNLPPSIVYTYPKSAAGAIKDEVKAFFSKVRCVTARGKNAFVPPRDGEVVLVEHDALRKIVDDLEPHMHRCMFVVDEFHKMLSSTTQRTQAALRLAYASDLSTILSATPVKDSRVLSLLPWLNLQVEYPVTVRNVLSAMASAYAVQIEVKIPIVRHIKTATLSNEEETNYAQAKALGGKESVNKMMRVANRAVTRKYMTMLATLLKRGCRVFMVAENKQHARELAERVRSAHPSVSMHAILDANTTVNVTPARVKANLVPNHRVVIAPAKMNMGFSLSTFNVMLTSAFPSNAAGRKQLEGRVPRQDSNEKKIYFYTVLTKILLEVHRKQLRGDSFAAIVNDLAEPVDAKGNFLSKKMNKKKKKKRQAPMPDREEHAKKARTK